MSYEDINNKLDQLNMEDAIWVIYIGIICLSWYSNILEKNYFIYNDNESKEEYRKIMVLIFGVLVIIYFYFLKSAVDDINKIRANDSKERKKLLYLSFIG